MTAVGIELVGGICDGLEYLVATDENEVPPPEVRLALAATGDEPSYSIAVYRCTYVIGDGSNRWRYAFHQVIPCARGVDGP